MQKKNVLTMALSVSLVGVIAVGGTLAYLTANTNKLTNKFTFVENGIKLELKETAQVPSTVNGFHGYTIQGIEAGATEKTVSANTADGEINYQNIVPGAVISKMPVLTVPSETDVSCYVYAMVTGLPTDSDFTVNLNAGEDDGKDWAVVDPAVYAAEVEGTDKFTADIEVLRYKLVVENEDADQPLPELFDRVTVSGNLTQADLNTVFNTNGIQIMGYAIQSDGVAASVADAEALKYFAGKLPVSTTTVD